MRAVVATGYGPPERYTVAEVPAPRPGPGQIQVAVAAASINPADIRVPSGEFGDAVTLQFPHVPGNYFAGTVSEVGPGVTAYRPGDEILGQVVPRALRALTGSASPSLEHRVPGRVRGLRGLACCCWRTVRPGCRPSTPRRWPPPA